MTSFINNIKKRIEINSANTDVEKQLVFLKYTYPSDIKIQGQIVNFEKLGIKGESSILTPLIYNYQKAFKLKDELDVNFFIKENKLFCSVSSVVVEVQTAEEIFILHEIWVEGCYNFLLPDYNDLVILDIGMNVGLASLFFAQKLPSSKVYSFEPFLPTYEQALVNLQLNKNITNIHPNNIGLSSTDESLIVDYSPSQRGRVGVWGTRLILEKIDEVSKQTLNLKSFNNVFKKIISENDHSQFVLKIDCEGSEYGVFEFLDLSLLENVKVILMEWHNNGPDEIEKVLLKKGFQVLSFNPKSKKVGMLYAFK